MAVKKKVVDLDTGNAQKSVKLLRNELKQLKDQLVNLDKGTKEYSETLQQAANIQHDLTEMNQELAASAMDFGQIMGNATSTINGAISGFQALTASMSLLGIENEDTLETIKKLQSLMALTQGIAGVENGIKAFKRLTSAITNSTTITNLFNKATKTTAVTEQATSAATKGLQGAMVGEAAATGTATVATNAFKKALISTGIGAIVVAVGVLIAHLEDLGKWLGIGGSSADAMAKSYKNLNEQLSINAMYINQTNKMMEQDEFNHELEIQAMELKIETMKAEGKTEAEIFTEREKQNAKLQEWREQDINLLNITEKHIEETFEKENGYQLNKYNMLNNIWIKEEEIRDLEETIAKINAGEEADGYTKKSLKYLEPRLEARKKELEQLNEYVKLQQKEQSIIAKTTAEDTKLSNDRVAAAKKASEERKKMVEEYKKFNNQIVLDTMANQDKEIEAIKQAEEAKKAELKKFKDKGIITETEYNEQLLKITEIYNKQRNEVEYKYAEQASKKREDILKQQFDLEKAEAERRATNQQMMLDQEHQNNVNALNRREISIVEYYNREKELIAKNYDAQRSLLEADFKRQSDLISEQINERYELLSKNGISDEQRTKLTAEVAQLSDQLLTIQTQHNAALQDLAIETNNIIAEVTQDTIQTEMDSLRALTDTVTAAMDSITGIGDGLSSEWATAFNTMSNGLIDLGQKVKEGGAGWQDYGQLAVAAFSAAGSVMKALADEQDTQTKEGFEQQKKFQIAAATMNMLGGVISAWTSAMNPANAWMTIWGQIAMGAASTAMILATGIMQIQKIKQQQFNGGGASASPSGSAMGSVVAPVQYTQDVQGAEIEGAIKDSKVYVVESDITGTQNKVDVAESEARY